jgi:hypothetical protein
MATRQATLLIRDRQVTGGALPANALLAEPFVNLFDGILKFSGVTGGGFEPSDVSTVFEVGSTLYNSKITNRLNINDNFIISGGTGLISTYGGATGAGLDGKFLSGTTNGFVLGDISDIQGISDITRVQPGTNITTGGTGNLPVVNLVDSPSINNLSFSGTATGGILDATTISGDTFYSGSTDLYDIFLTSGDLSGTSVSAGANIGVVNVGNNYEVSVVNSPSFNDISFSGTANGGAVDVDSVTATTMSAGTIYSGSTNLYDIFITQDTTDVTRVQPGTNITTGGTATEPIVNVVDSPNFAGEVTATGITDSSLTDTRVVFAGTGGKLTDDAGMTYNAGTDVLTVNGNYTTNGTQYSGGTIVDDGIFTIDAATQVEVDSNLLPTSHLTYDLGAPGQRWDELYVRKVQIGTSTTVIEDNLFSSTTGNMVFNFAGDLDVDNNIIPLLDKTYDLGEVGTRWKTIYAQDLDLAGDLQVTGITDSSLTAGRVVYVGVGGRLVDEAGFEYDETNNLLKTSTLQVGNNGDTGTTLTVYGDILALGQAISGFTSELYIEDNLIELNYNPTASTESTSLGAGFSIQDGSGSAGTDAFFDIRGTGVGIANRGFATNLNDIYIREDGTTGSPGGVRVIAELDVIDGGSY